MAPKADPAPAAEKKPAPSEAELLKGTMKGLAQFFLVIVACVASYRIRLYAVARYGRVIHEFDPWWGGGASSTPA